uniref:Ribosomal RNA small subunit methyltransferase NEP1 n=1 Tax=Chrysotila carterae TaxID=13221 RepID=A0A7S4EY60_CHRCT
MPKRKAPSSNKRETVVEEEDHDDETEQQGEAAESFPAATLPVESAVVSDGRAAKQPKVIFVLERACLETGKVGAEHVLLNSDDHAKFLMKHKRAPADYRPDILHQSMLILLDAPLNKAGLMKLFVRSEKGVLIDVNPQIRIPRTFRRFSGLMTQLLFKLSIRASNGPQKLLKVIKNPVTDHLPPNARIICMSVTGKLVSLAEYIPSLPKDCPIVFVAGAMAHGKVEPEYADDYIAVSEYPLSAAAALARVTNAFENYLGVL